MSSKAARPKSKRSSDHHVHVFNTCACGMMQPFSLNNSEGYHHSSQANGDAGIFGKEETVRHGQALISKAVTSKQIDMRMQYDDDSDAVGNSVDKITESLNELSSDIKELGRCLKSGAFAASQLKKVQEKVTNELKVALLREKHKMDLKDEKIAKLSRKVDHIKKKQAAIYAGYRRYQTARNLVIVLVIALVALSIVSVILSQDKTPDTPSNSSL